MTCQAHRGIVCSYPQENCPCLALLAEHEPQQLETCPACDGSGVEVYGVTVFEHGCGFHHDSTDERACPECKGNGFVLS